MSWHCTVKGCTEPTPAEPEDQPHCEACRAHVCEAHVVTRRHVRLCPACHMKEKSAMLAIASEMTRAANTILVSYHLPEFRDETEPAEIQAICERWIRELSEVS